MKHINYETFELQSYLKRGNICTEETQVLTALRSKCVKSARMNFSRMFKGRTNCPLKCNNEEPHEDTQEHLLTCKMNIHTGTELLNIEQAFYNIAKQEEIAQTICKIIRKRADLLDILEEDNIPPTTLPHVGGGNP